MKTQITVMVLSLFSFTLPAQDCVYYEYKITSEKESDGISGFLKCFNFLGNSRVESLIKIPNMPQSLTKSTNLSKADAAGKIFLLIPAAKMYSEVSFSKFSENAKSEEDYDIAFRGSEVVNGYNTTHVIYRTNSYTSGKKETELWISKGVPGFTNYVVSKANQFFNDDDLFKVLNKRGAEGIPVRIKSVEFGSTVIFDLVKAEKREADNSIFEVPFDYTQTTSAKLSSAQEVVEDMQDMSKDEVQVFLEQLKKKYMLE